MPGIVLPTRRPWDGRLFGVLVALNVPAAFALLPFAMDLQNTFAAPEAQAPLSWAGMVADRIVTLAILVPLAAIGLALARRIGLGMPFLESRLQGVAPPRAFRGIVAVAAIVGIGSAALILMLDLGAFAPSMNRLILDLGLKTPQGAIVSPWRGFLAAISAGITEETTFRLFGLTFLAWIGGLVFRSEDDRPRPAVLWTANVVFALVFGAAHLSTARAIGLPLNALVLTRTFVLNGAAGIAFGWVFWTWGLECAMLAHFFTDVGLYTLLPVVQMQEGAGAKSVAGAIVGVAVVAGMIWAVRTLRAARVLAEAAGGE